MLVEKRFDAGEVELNYAESPPNGLPIILIHGTSGKWQSLQPIIPSLSMRWHVYALDLRGHGLSNRAPGKYNLKNYHKDVINFIEKKVKEPVRLFGHSMGGMISTMIANTHPHLVHSLIIGDSPPNNNRSMLKIIRVLMPWWKLIKETAEQKLSVKDTWKYYQKTKPTILSGPAGEPINLLTSAMSFSRTDPEVVVPLIDGFEDHTVFDSWVEGYETREIYPKLRCHVMLIRGNPELGGAIFDDEFEEAKKTIPNLVYVYLPNHGHDLFPSGAEPVGSMINSFLEALR